MPATNFDLVRALEHGAVWEFEPARLLPLRTKQAAIADLRMILLVSKAGLAG